MARIDWVEQRLQNWARWRLMQGSGVLGYAGVDLTKLADSDAGRDGYITATIPISDIEAGETDAVVQRLPSELRATVESAYTGKGTMRERCTRLCITEDTFYRRVDRAHRLMAEHWRHKQAMQAEERARIEALTKQAAPRGFYVSE